MNDIVVDIHGRPFVEPPACDLARTLASLEAGLNNMRWIAHHKPEMFTGVMVTIDGHPHYVSEVLGLVRDHIDAITRIVAPPQPVPPVTPPVTPSRPPIVRITRRSRARKMIDALCKSITRVRGDII